MNLSWLSPILLAMMNTAPSTNGTNSPPQKGCPSDMKLVEGIHYDNEEHVCTNLSGTHCFAYEEGVTLEYGESKNIQVCMDIWEAPNKKGAKPLVMQSYNMAKQWCSSKGKRVCGEEEWELACEGPTRQPWVYGWKNDKKICNSGKKWVQFDVQKLVSGGDDAEKEVARLWQGDPSGIHSGCVSSFGIQDMMGNVEEWVTSRKGRKWPGALMGGFWSKPWTGCRGTNDAHEPTFTFYETGFRCCQDPK